MEGKRCLKENVPLHIGRNGRFIVILALSLPRTLLSKIVVEMLIDASIMPRSYRNDFITFLSIGNILNLVPFFYAIKQLDIQMVLYSQKFLRSKVSILFFLWKESLRK